MSVLLVIENEFDNFDNYDNYNLNLLLIKRIILRSRKQGSPHAHLMNSIPSKRIEKFTRQTRIRDLSLDSFSLHKYSIAMVNHCLCRVEDLVDWSHQVKTAPVIV